MSAVVLLATSCVGTIDDTLPLIPQQCRSTASLLPRLGVRRLTRVEYRNSVHDVLDVEPPELTALPEDGELASFTTTIGQTLNASAVAKYLDAAEVVAARVLARGLPDGCGGDERSCVRGFIVRTGERLARRPLTEDELNGYVARFDDVRRDDDLATSLGVVLTALLVSPEFLFVSRTNTGAGGPGYAIAAHLAHGLWRTNPDVELMRAAAAGELATNEGIARQVDRLAADPRATSTLRAFIEQWLGVSAIAKINVQQTQPDVTPEVVSALAQETMAFIEDAVVTHRDYRKLFVSDRVFRNRVLSQYYGDGLAGGEALQAFAVTPSQQSFGLLSQAGVLMAASKNEETSIIYRGKFVRARLLCGELALPPEGLLTGLPSSNPFKTSRERIENHTAGSTCQGCHSQMNPIGYALLHFDGSGRWQDTEHGEPIDSGATVDGLGTIDGAYGLSQALFDSGEASQCVATTLVTMARAERLRGDDGCLAAAFGEHFATAGYDMATLMAAVVREQAYAIRGSAP